MDEWERLGVIALVTIFTVLFDGLDLHPQVHSFHFFRTLTYTFYAAYRIVLGAIASFLLAEAFTPAPAFYVLAMFGTLTCLTLLQSLALNVAGTEVVNLSELVNRHKARMIEQESRRQALRMSTRSLSLQQRLCLLPTDVLETELQRMFLGDGYTADEAKEQVNALKGGLSASDDLYQMVLASHIAAINPDFAEQLLTIRKVPPVRAAVK